MSSASECTGNEDSQAHEYCPEGGGVLACDGICVESGDYDFNVKWGDNTEDDITELEQPGLTHTYSESGT